MPDDFKFQLDPMNENQPTDTASLPPAPVLTDPVMPETPIVSDTVSPVTFSPPPVKPIPASIPLKSSSVGVFFTVLLALLCLSSLAAATYFYFQNQTLIAQINTVQSTLDQRQLETEPTPTISISPEATPTVKISPDGGRAQQSEASGSSGVILAVIALAQKSAPQAQLLMITGDNLQDETKATYKYWFRRSAGTKTYLFVQVSPNKSPQLFLQATVSPDNNIPDLIATFTSNQAGLDSTEALATISNLGTPVSITAKYLKALPNNAEFTAPVLLWQFVCKYASQKDLIVQINATTGELLYTSASTK